MFTRNSIVLRLDPAFLDRDDILITVIFFVIISKVQYLRVLVCFEHWHLLLLILHLVLLRYGLRKRSWNDVVEWISNDECLIDLRDWVTDRPVLIVNVSLKLANFD